MASKTASRPRAAAPPVKDLTSAERCTEEVIRRIRNGTLRPTHRLGEDSIARELGIGRAPVRIAFERLVSAGVLEREHRAGTFVRGISLEEWCELMDLRAVLEGSAVRLVSARATDGQVAHLLKIAREVDALDEASLRHPTRDRSRLMELELEFHNEIARLCGNRHITKILATQHLVAQCLQSPISPSYTPGKIDAANRGEVYPDPVHAVIAEAIAKRDGDLAERLMREHVLAAKKNRVLHVLGTGS